MSQLPPEVYTLIDAALSEDQAFNDPTTGTLIPPDIRAAGALRAKAVGVVAGVDVAKSVFHRVDPSLEVEVRMGGRFSGVPGGRNRPGRGQRGQHPQGRAGGP